MSKDLSMNVNNYFFKPNYLKLRSLSRWKKKKSKSQNFADHMLEV